MSEEMSDEEAAAWRARQDDRAYLLAKQRRFTSESLDGMIARGEISPSFRAWLWVRALRYATPEARAADAPSMYDLKSAVRDLNDQLDTRVALTDKGRGYVRDQSRT